MDRVQTLIVELPEWIGPRDHPYEVLGAWRTTCPRLPVWEDARAAGYLETRFEPGEGRFAVSSTGRALLFERGCG
jgi:hypothetical protein